MSLPTITQTYLLAINIPVYRDAGSGISADHLWFKDLAEHLGYLDCLLLACPVVDEGLTEAAVSFASDARFLRLRVIELPVSRSLVQAVFALPRTAWRLWKAVRTAEVVHSGVAGWPIPYGWIVTPMAKMLGKKLVIIVESAPWRINAGSPTGMKARVMAGVYERMARWCLRRADLAIFTQNEYRQSLLRGEPEKGHIIHASWIDEGVIIPDERAAAIWCDKTSREPGGLSLLFVGRLEPQKGVPILLEAMIQLSRKNVPVTLDILGSGELAAQCGALNAELRGPTRVQMLGTVAYGAPLFDLLQKYHAVVIPTISDEQPRIVYDAYSQGVPALASSTAGLRDCIQEDRTGWLVEPNNVDKLSELFERAAGHIEDLRRMGMQALQVAREMTHQRMHLERQRLLLQLNQPPAP